jgi:hypothetical protein
VSGVGLLASLAVAQGGKPPVGAPPQAGAPPAAPADSQARGDSSRHRRALTAADTIKAPLTESYAPTVMGTRNVRLHWDRAQLFEGGALTLGDILARIPGVTLMTTGVLLAPSVPAWHGDPGGIRVYLDGVEREEVTPRNGGVTDFSLIPLWALEDLVVEEWPGELRVYARSWRVDRTTASTRTDILTGSDNLNLFRGYFGKRASNGIAVQFAAQQASLISLPGMDGDALGAMGRLGWAGGSWSVDATILRQGLNRNAGNRILANPPVTSAIPAYHGAATTSYVRAGWRSPSAEGLWAQAIAASVGASLTHPTSGSSGNAAADSSADTTVAQRQYTIMGGVNRGAIRAMGGLRVRSFEGSSDFSPLARLDLNRPYGALSLSAERRHGGVVVWDARTQASPREWLRLSATAGAWRSSAASAAAAGSAVEAAVRVAGWWLGAGAVRVGDRDVLGPVEFDTTAKATRVPGGTGLKVSFGGPMAGGWNLQSDVVNWGSGTALRPQTEARTRLWFDSRFLGVAPRGNLNVLAQLTHEYRSQFFVPKGDDALGQQARSYNVYSALVEVRIATAVVYWDYRNMTGLTYATFPGYLMPRILNVYGVRWDFWN